MPELLPLAGRIAVVTGATRGIGRAAALALNAAGAQVIAVGRTQGALEDLDDEARAQGGQPVTLVPLDLTQPDGLDELGLAIFQRHGRLDILLHAAGTLSRLRPVAHVPLKVWDTIMATNVTSVYRLIRSFEPLLRAAPAGRAIFLTDSVAAAPKAFWGAYAASKAGLETLARSWATEVARSTLKINLVDPGPVRTHLRAQAFPGEDAAKHRTPDEVTAVFVDLAAPDCTITGQIVDA